MGAVPFASAAESSFSRRGAGLAEKFLGTGFTNRQVPPRSLRLCVSQCPGLTVFFTQRRRARGDTLNENRLRVLRKFLPVLCASA